MAFGLGFNKTKVLSAAEKFVAQGKIPAAIDEYMKLLDRDQRDLTILNTVADLCVRSGKTDEAVKRFHELAERCVEVGLIARAIATYKRITKIEQNSVQALLRLGDLYAMQGLLRDARSHYLQVVEHHYQSQEKDKARDVFEKVLMLDAENPQLQLRMAKLYAETGRTPDAVAMYGAATERFLDTDKPAEAKDAVQGILQIESDSADAYALMARVQMAQGEMNEAIATLGRMTESASDTKSLTLLFQAYDRIGDRNRARDAANKLFDQHNDFSALAQVSDEMISRQQLSGALAIYEGAFERLLERRASGVLIQGIRNITDAEPSNSAALELLLQAYRKCGNLSEARDTAETLATLYRKRGDLERAREYYKQLAELEPGNDEHSEMLQSVEVEMGIVEAPAPMQSPAMSAMVPDLQTPISEEKPAADAVSAREEQQVANAITEAELYKTYRQTSRAIQAIESALLDAPGNVALSEYLLGLCEESQHYAKAAECCEALTEAYIKLGDGERAARYGDLCLTYRQRAQEQGPPPEDAPAEAAGFDPMSADADFGGTTQAASANVDPPEIREVDLSMEWASVGNVGDDLTAAESDTSLVEEVEFYIQAGLAAEAEATLSRLELANPLHASILDFRRRLGLQDKAAQPKPVSEPAPEAPQAFEFSMDDLNSEPSIAVPDASETAAFYTDLDSPANEPAAAAFDSILESASPAAASFAAESPVVAAPLAQAALPPAMKRAAPLMEPAHANSSMGLSEDMPLVDAASGSSEFELSLDSVEMQPRPPRGGIIEQKKEELFAELSQEFDRALDGARRSHAAPEPLPGAPSPNMLDELFREFKSEVEEPVKTGDIETHYNLGVAFKEMALYDEAIGEFQKAHQIAEESGDFSNVVQCCSLVATCFIEKGLPQLAVRWYQTALDSPGVDAESKLALLYEMGSSYELAGDGKAALDRFLEVYARNIDYRDVASRIRSLQQPR